jgi:hypothetical protein
MNDSQPSYKLIQAKTLETDCSVHAREFLLDLYNQANGETPGPWKMLIVGIDKIQFRCSICGSERVYKILDEKTLLQ